MVDDNLPSPEDIARNRAKALGQPYQAPADTRGYTNLRSVASGLTSLGAFVRTIALVIGVVIFSVGVFKGWFAYYDDKAIGIGIIFVSVILGLVLYLFGVLISAFGEVLLAVADIAANTKETADLLKLHT